MIHSSDSFSTAQDDVWVQKVILDLMSFSLANKLPKTAAALEEAYATAKEELEQPKKGAPNIALTSPAH